MTIHTGLVETKIRLSWRHTILLLYLCSWENKKFQNRIDFSLIAKKIMPEYGYFQGIYLNRSSSKVHLMFMPKICVLTVHR